MTIDEIKKWIVDNQKGLIVGVIAGLVIRGLIR